MRIGLISCGKLKRETTDGPVPARDLYTSPLFRKAAAYATATYDRWFVLSALHGVVAPDAPLVTYDRALTDLTPRERDWWALGVERDLRPWRDDHAATLYLHAGGLYAQLVMRVAPVERPLRGLGIGQQLRWYKERGY